MTNPRRTGGARYLDEIGEYVGARRAAKGALGQRQLDDHWVADGPSPAGQTRAMVREARACNGRGREQTPRRRTELAFVRWLPEQILLAEPFRLHQGSAELDEDDRRPQLSPCANGSARRGSWYVPPPALLSGP